MSLKLITLVGKPGSGTTTAARSITQQYRGEIVSTSELLNARIKERDGLERESTRQERIDLGLELGDEGIVDLVYSIADSGLYVLDRALYTPQVEAFWQRGSLIVLVGAPKSVCVERMLETWNTPARTKEGFTGVRDHDFPLARKAYEKDGTDVLRVHQTLADHTHETHRRWFRTDVPLQRKIETYLQEPLDRTSSRNPAEPMVWMG